MVGVAGSALGGNQAGADHYQELLDTCLFDGLFCQGEREDLRQAQDPQANTVAICCIDFHAIIFMPLDAAGSLTSCQCSGHTMQ